MLGIEKLFKHLSLTFLLIFFINICTFALTKHTIQNINIECHILNLNIQIFVHPLIEILFSDQFNPMQ